MSFNPNLLTTFFLHNRMLVIVENYTSAQQQKFKTLIINHLRKFLITKRVRKRSENDLIFTTIHKSTAN